MAIKQRAYPDSGQLDVLVSHIGQVRFLYNLGLEQRKLWRRGQPSVTAAGQMRELTELRGEIDWLKAGSTVIQQGALRDLDRAFGNFFAGRSKYPTFKKREHKTSFVIRDLRVRRYNRKWGAVLVPKTGWLRFKITRAWTDIESASSARVVLHQGTWHVSFVCPAPEKRTTGSGVVGLDRGIAVTVMTSDGESFQVPILNRREQERFLSLERRLARQKKGSTRRRRTKDQLTVLRRRLTNRRTDWCEKTTTELATRYEIAVIEKLRVTQMSAAAKPKPDPDTPGSYLPNGAAAKSALNRLIAGSVWGGFASRLTDKMTVETIPAPYTSQRCNVCDHTDKQNRESQASFRCTACGHTDNADLNAARNIRDLFTGEQFSGLRTLGQLDVPEAVTAPEHVNLQLAV